jgi:hypothetical protein
MANPRELWQGTLLGRTEDAGMNEKDGVPYNLMFVTRQRGYYYFFSLFPAYSLENQAICNTIQLQSSDRISNLLYFKKLFLLCCMELGLLSFLGK